MQENKTLVVNLFGGPGTGKSTGGTYIFSRLKQDGIDAEYVSEFAKDKVWEKNQKVFHCEMYIAGKQLFKISRVNGEVAVIITDSPVLQAAIYLDDKDPLKAAIINESKKFRNLDVFFDRVKKYNPNGRNQTEEEARAMDKQILNLVEANCDDSSFVRTTADIKGYDQVVQIIKDILENGFDDTYTCPNCGRVFRTKDNNFATTAYVKNSTAYTDYYYRCPCCGKPVCVASCKNAEIKVDEGNK